MNSRSLRVVRSYLQLQQQQQRRVIFAGSGASIFHRLTSPELSHGISNYCTTATATTAAVVVSAALVKELRAKTGAPMMDCKKALAAEDVSGDVAKAMDWLRKKGMARASNSNSSSNSSERVAAEGLVAAAVCSKSGSVVMLEVNSETDFVGMNKDFQLFVAAVCESILQRGFSAGNVAIDDILLLKPAATTTATTTTATTTAAAAAVATTVTTNTAVTSDTATTAVAAETIGEALGDLTAAIRETIIIKRALILHPTSTAIDSSNNNNSSSSNSNSCIAVYVHGKVGADHLPPHLQMGKAAAAVQLSGITTEVAAATAASVGKKLAMHVVAAKPSFLQAADVPADIVQRESQIFREQTIAAEETANSSSGSAKASQQKQKSAEMIDKIVSGKVQKRLNELCLLGQAHVAEEGAPNVQKFLQSQSLHCSSFQLWTLG